MHKLLLKEMEYMSKKELVTEIIYTTLLRGFLMLFGAFVFAIVGMIGKLIAIGIAGLYIYTVIDEFRLFREAYREAEH